MYKILRSNNDNTIAAIYAVELGKEVFYPIIGTEIPAGFPSPAQDYIEGSLDLNDFLVEHPTATFFVKVQGCSMVNAGINPDDILIVDRSLEPLDKRIVIAVVNGDFTVKRLRIKQNRWFLTPENPEFLSMEITEEMDFHIWGVVTFAIHPLS